MRGRSRWSSFPVVQVTRRGGRNAPTPLTSTDLRRLALLDHAADRDVLARRLRADADEARAIADAWCDQAGDPKALDLARAWDDLADWLVGRAARVEGVAALHRTHAEILGLDGR